jgi:hypothetical protein
MNLAMPKKLLKENGRPSKDTHMQCDFAKHFCMLSTYHPESWVHENPKNPDNHKNEVSMSPKDPTNSDSSGNGDSSDKGGSSNSVKTMVAKEMVPSDDDVLLGRGTKHHLHPGNQRYNGKAANLLRDIANRQVLTH